MARPRIFDQFVSTVEKNANDVSVGNTTIEANGQITSSNLKLTSAVNGTGNIAIIGKDGQIYYRTPAELLNDISAAAKSTVESLSSDLSSTKSTVSTLSTDVKDTKISVGTLSGDLKTTKTTVNSLSSDVSSAKSSISSLNTTINSLPKNIFYVGTTAPTDKKLLWVDTTSNSGLKYYNGSAWVTMPVCWGE